METTTRGRGRWSNPDREKRDRCIFDETVDEGSWVGTRKSTSPHFRCLFFLPVGPP